MAKLFCLFLILCPVKPIKLPGSDWLSPLLPDLRHVAATLELIDPAESDTYWYENPMGAWEPRSVTFEDRLRQAWRNYRLLRAAPSLTECARLPDRATCRAAESFWEDRLDYIQRQTKLYGEYRHGDAEPCLEGIHRQLQFWSAAAIAKDAKGRSYLDRRQALEWLRDHDRAP